MPNDPAGLFAPAASVCELSLVIPAFNEAGVLGDAVAAIARSAAEVTADYEILVVDDGSSDATWPTVTAAHEADARVCGLRLSRNFGKDAALSAGIKHSRGRAVVVLDADLQHPPALIPELYRAWRRGAEIVNGIKRDRTKEPFIRRALSRMFHLAASRLTGLDFNNSSDFKLLDRRVVNAWLALPERRSFFRGMVAWLGFRAEDIYFDVAPRAGGGGSKYGVWRLARMAWSAASSYSVAPLHIIHFLSATFLSVGVVLGARAFYQKLTGQAIGGFTTVIILELLMGGFILLSLGIIAEYLAAIYEETKCRPRYIVAESLPAGYRGTIAPETHS